MSIDQIELGRRIRLAREGNGMTQEELGQQIELSRVAVTQIEQGKRGVGLYGLRAGGVTGTSGRATMREMDALDGFLSTSMSGAVLAGMAHWPPSPATLAPLPRPH